MAVVEGRLDVRAGLDLLRVERRRFWGKAIDEAESSVIRPDSLAIGSRSLRCRRLGSSFMRRSEWRRGDTPRGHCSEGFPSATTQTRWLPSLALSWGAFRRVRTALLGPTGSRLAGWHAWKELMRMEVVAAY